MDMQKVNEFFATARERYLIRQRRESGLNAPWSDDPIFQQWRFCNVHREDDKTTVWFRDNVRSKVDGLRAVEATILFRWFNRIETGEHIVDLLVDGWDPDEARSRLENVHPLVTGAYMLKTLNGYNKLDGILVAFDQLRPSLPDIVSRWGGSLREAWDDLLPLPCLGRFTSYEIVTDLRWTPVLEHADDIMTWACAGPGCARGIGRTVHDNVHAFSYGSNTDQQEMLGYMSEILEMSRDSRFWPSEWTQWEMREVEHWACEFDKYERAREGSRLKRRFV